MGTSRQVGQVARYLGQKARRAMELHVALKTGQWEPGDCGMLSVHGEDMESDHYRVMVFHDCPVCRQQGVAVFFEVDVPAKSVTVNGRAAPLQHFEHALNDACEMVRRLSLAVCARAETAPSAYLREA